MEGSDGPYDDVNLESAALIGTPVPEGFDVSKLPRDLIIGEHNGEDVFKWAPRKVTVFTDTGLSAQSPSALEYASSIGNTLNYAARWGMALTARIYDPAYIRGSVVEHDSSSYFAKLLRSSPRYQDIRFTSLTDPVRAKIIDASRSFGNGEVNFSGETEFGVAVYDRELFHFGPYNLYVGQQTMGRVDVSAKWTVSITQTIEPDGTVTGMAHMQIDYRVVDDFNIGNSRVWDLGTVVNKVSWQDNVTYRITGTER
ncbi:hypothetical protein LCGC14_2227190 [marine sediment metagenome]|uniref:Uncharacterized protein n=1 Tax=marine sediment metagenome TaxID=412755 RepID=A0A0F9DWX3_9ZZZZ